MLIPYNAEWIQKDCKYFSKNTIKSALELFKKLGLIRQLYSDLDEVMESYLEVKIENNLPIPLPEQTENYSGKFNVRLPKPLHQRLAIEAKNEGVSLNQLVLYKLAL